MGHGYELARLWKMSWCHSDIFINKCEKAQNYYFTSFSLFANSSQKDFQKSIIATAPHDKRTNAQLEAFLCTHADLYTN